MLHVAVRKKGDKKMKKNSNTPAPKIKPVKVSRFGGVSQFFSK